VLLFAVYDVRVYVRMKTDARGKGFTGLITAVNNTSVYIDESAE